MMKKDFNIYQNPEPDPHLAIVMDLEDPQRKDILTAAASIMEKAGRYTEADECKSNAE